jgi:xylan 1,4-beta-xylosidase
VELASKDKGFCWGNSRACEDNTMMPSGGDVTWPGLPGTHNPVIHKMDLADPDVILYDGRYYLYPTDEAGGALGFDVYISDDLVHWTQGPRVFSDPGPNVWAPEVYHDPDTDLFFLYYTSNMRIGVAVADSPLGPFVNRGVLIEDAIDANLFRDENGRLYLYYSYAPPVYVRRLTGSLRVQRMVSPIETDGDPIDILFSESWERFLGIVGIIEGPWMLKRNGIYYLMYSGNATSSVDYAIGYATASDPLGPFTKYAGNPVLYKGGGIMGPGHNSVVEAPDGSLVIVYHQKSTPRFLWWYFGDRVVCVDQMVFDHAGNIRIAPKPLRAG